MCFPTTTIYRLLGWGNLRIRKGRENPTIHFYFFLFIHFSQLGGARQEPSLHRVVSDVQFCNYLFLSASLHVIIFLRFMKKMPLQRSCCMSTPSQGNTVMVNCLYHHHLTQFSSIWSKQSELAKILHWFSVVTSVYHAFLNSDNTFFNFTRLCCLEIGKWRK